MKSKKSKKQPIVMTQAKIRKITEQVTWETIVWFTAAAMDEFQWTDDEVFRLIETLNRYQQAKTDGYITTHKAAKIIEEVTGVKFEKKFDKGWDNGD